MYWKEQGERKSVKKKEREKKIEEGRRRACKHTNVKKFRQCKYKYKYKYQMAVNRMPN